MTLEFHPLGQHIGAEAEGIDLREPLTAAHAAQIHDAMDRHAVLVFHRQPLTNEQHMAFTLALGPIESAARNSLRQAADFRLPPNFADVSNLDGANKPYARDDRKRTDGLFANRFGAFYKFTPPFFGQRRNIQTDNCAVIIWCQTQTGFKNGFFYGGQSFFLPRLYYNGTRIGSGNIGNLCERCRRTVIRHHHIAENIRIGFSGAYFCQFIL